MHLVVLYSANGNSAVFYQWSWFCNRINVVMFSFETVTRNFNIKCDIFLLDTIHNLIIQIWADIFREGSIEFQYYSELICTATDDAQHSCLIYISGFYGNRGGNSPKWKHDKYEEVVQMEEPSSTTDN